MRGQAGVIPPFIDNPAITMKVLTQRCITRFQERPVTEGNPLVVLSTQMSDIEVPSDSGALGGEEDDTVLERADQEGGPDDVAKYLRLMHQEQQRCIRYQHCQRHLWEVTTKLKRGH